MVRFNFSVRNGKRWNPHAMATLIRFLCHVTRSVTCDKVKKEVRKIEGSLALTRVVYSFLSLSCLPLSLGGSFGSAGCLLLRSEAEGRVLPSGEGMR